MIAYIFSSQSTHKLEKNGIDRLRKENQHHRKRVHFESAALMFRIWISL